MRFALPLGEFQHGHRAFDVDPVGRDRGEFAAGGEQGGEVEDAVDLVLGQDAVEQRRVEDRADELLADEGGQLAVERIEVERDDGPIVLPGDVLDQAVADFAGGAGDEDDGFAEHAISLATLRA